MEGGWQCCLYYDTLCIKIRLKARSLFPVLLVCSETGWTVYLVSRCNNNNYCLSALICNHMTRIYIYSVIKSFPSSLPLAPPPPPPNHLPLHHPTPHPPTTRPALPFRPMLARLVVTLCWDCLHVQWCGRWNTRNAYNYSPWWAGVDFTNRNRCNVCQTSSFLNLVPTYASPLRIFWWRVTFSVGVISCL